MSSLARAWPTVIKNIIWWNHEHVSIDQRPASQTGPDYYIHVLVIPHVEHSVRFFTAVHQPLNVFGSACSLSGKRPKVVSEIAWLPRKRPHGVPLAALEDKDPPSVPFLGQAAGSDGSSKTCSNY